jgi:hypothetical protein
MTNDELNRTVATLRGLTIRETQEECSEFAPDGHWNPAGEYYEQTVVWCIPSAYLETWDADDQLETSIDWYQYQGVPDYCTDPAAWGGLLIELAGEELGPSLCVTYDGKRWDATVGRWKPKKLPVSDPLPGRALCLAYIASQEGR